MVDWRIDKAARADPSSAHLERLHAAQAWASLSAGESAALAASGFDPVGRVLGTAVVHTHPGSRAGLCGGPGSWRTHFTPGAGALRTLALSRAVAECDALGGDGIVGVTVRVTPFAAGGTEFTVQGTAVRARTAIRPAVPFTSHMSAPEFASLLQAGWVPAAIIVAVSAGFRHDATRHRQTLPNREMKNYTELVNDVRSEARTKLRRAAVRQAADGVVLDEISMHISERECESVGGSDLLAEAVILGTSIVSFGRSSSATDRTPLSIMRLNPASSAIPVLSTAKK